MESELRNWAGNYRYGAARLHRPTTIEELRALVMRRERVRALGTRHSFNEIADTDQDLISTERFNRVLEVDHVRRTVTVEAGIRYGDLCKQLAAASLALHNLASLPHISVAGACATATHGSGDGNGNLATAVSGMEIVTADGEIRQLSRTRDEEEFLGAVVGLGALGIVTKLTLDVSPAFEMRQDVYENLPLQNAIEHFDEISSSAYSVSLFTDWSSANFSQVWAKSVVGDAAFEPPCFLYGASLATEHRHPIVEMSAENCTPQLGSAGPWHERMTHFRLDFTPSCGEELQTEYLLPRVHAAAAFRAIARLRERITPLLQVSEVRTVAADDLWMSTSFGRPSVAIHFTWMPDWPAVREILPLIEAELEPFAARPHWGKLFTMSPERLKSLYPKLPDFRRLLHDFDPAGKFRNSFIDTYIA